MTSAKVRVQHTTREGIQRFIDYQLYGMLKACSYFGTAGLFVRKAEEESVSKFLENERILLGRVRDSAQALRRYFRMLDERGIVDQGDIAIRKEKDPLRIEVGASCPYRTVCEWADREQRLPRCFRAIAFAEVLRRSTGRPYEGLLDRFGLPCHLTLAPSRLGAGAKGKREKRLG